MVGSILKDNFLGFQTFIIFYLIVSIEEFSLLTFDKCCPPFYVVRSDFHSCEGFFVQERGLSD